MKPITLVRAPSNLGLRPLHAGHVPGAWRAPASLTSAGLLEALQPERIVDLERPGYSPDAQRGSWLLNGPAIRTFDLQVAGVVEQARELGRFPLVMGGDCSVLLGALAGVRRRGPASLVHVDGHSDFRHPGNYDPQSRLGAVAGMDLALATGRGEPLLTEWPGVEGPLVPDRQVIQIGERECRDADWAWPDLWSTAIRQISVFDARDHGIDWTLQETRATLKREPSWPFWVHFDVDVLDQDVMPAVDSPGSPGLGADDLAVLLRGLVQDGRCAGMTVTVYDPDRDVQGACAELIVKLLAATFRR